MRYFTTLLVLLASPCVWSQQTDLSLNHYLTQVQEQDDDYLASKKSFEGADLNSHEGDVITSPNLFASAQHTDDARPNLLFNYDKQIMTEYQLGVSDQTPYGLQGKVFYDLQDIQYRNLAFNSAPVTIGGIQGSPTVQLTLSIWRNLFGRETDNQVEQKNASNRSQKFNQSYNMKSLLLKGESAYWNLSVARETVKVSKDALDRALQLQRYNSNKADSGLADRADVLQAQAATENRRLDLKTAEDSEQTAAREFNSLRGQDSSAVNDKLSPLTADRLNKLQVPPRTELRDDTQAALETKLASIAAAKTSLEGYKPTFEVFGTYALNNNNPVNASSGEAVNDSFFFNRPTETIGLRFNAPLELGLIHDVQQGWNAQLSAADLTYKRRLFEQEAQWSDLKEKFQQAKDRLNIYENLVRVEKQKLDYEKIRHQRGRTTTEQVIQFEADYEQAQFGRIKTMSEILTLLAQMKTYGATYESR